MRPAGRALVAAALAVTVVGATGPGALARHTTVRDRNDTNGALDVKSATVRHFSPSQPIWVIDTWKRWTKKRMWDRGFFFVYLDTRWKEPPEYYVLIRSTGKAVQALLFRDRAAGNDRLIKPLTVWRWNQRRVAFKLTLHGLLWGPERTFYRWSVVTTMTGEICPTVCLDVVPDTGSVRQERK